MLAQFASAAAARTNGQHIRLSACMNVQCVLDMHESAQEY